MPTISQAQINRLAFKQGVRPEDIASQLQSKGYTAPATTQEAGVTLPGVQQTTPVSPITTTNTGNTIPPVTQSWDVVGKQKDPTQVSNYLNTQSGFKTTVSGNTVTGTKNGVNTTWIYDGANWVTKPTIATGDNPVIGNEPATNVVTTPGGFDTYEAMTPEQRYRKATEIYMKGGKDITDEEKKFMAYTQFQGATGKDVFGLKTTKSSGTTTYSQELVQPGENIASSERQSDGTYKVTYKDGTSQITTSEPSTTVFPEGTPEYYAQKQAEEGEKRIQVLTDQVNKAEEKRKKDTEELVAKYGENIASQFQAQKAEIEANGAKRIEATKSMLSGRGAGRSGMAVEQVDEIAKNIQDTINQAKAKADLELMAYRMEREGADAEAISAMRTNIANVQQKIDDANYANQLKIIELNQQNATTGAEAMNNLLATISNADELMKDIDFEKSALHGYLVDKKTGKTMFDSQGRPMKFENSVSGLEPNEIQTFSELLKTGKVDIEGLKKLGLNPAEIADISKDYAIQTGTWTGATGGDITTASGDLRGLRSQYPREAWSGTNNPTGLTVSSSFSQKLNNAGIQFTTKPRPSNEGGEYYVFEDIQDGLQAHNLALKTSGWQDIYQRLYKWSAGGTQDTPQAEKEANKKAYAENLMRQADIPMGTTFSELTPEQEAKLLSAHIAKESPNLYKVLTSGGGSSFSDNQKNVMDNIVGEPTLAQTKELSSAGLNTGDLQSYRQEKKSTGDYSTQDLDFIGKIDEKVTKSKVYQDINSSQQFISNLMVALDRNSALGDIAAINQFQKIIDEGAVTRDQDVKLVQSAESLLGKMKLLYDKVQNGQQLTQNQRNEMRAIGKQLLDGKSKIFSNDPGIKALRKQLSSRGIKEDAGIFGEVGVFDTGTTPTGQTGGEVVESDWWTVN